MISAFDLVRVWELGEGQPLWYRGLLLLALAQPQQTLEELCQFTIGQRNRCLFTLYQHLLGTNLQATVQCPQCSEMLEFTFNLEGLGIVSETEIKTSYTIENNGIELTFRLLNSKDLAAISQSSNLEEARQQLIRRSLIKATQDGQEIKNEQLTTTTIQILGEAIVDCDPQSELLLNLDCPNCRNAWSDQFDIVAFLWSEISTQAKSLLEEVHLLAQAYGWPEETILGMTTKRRKYYLGRIEQ